MASYSEMFKALSDETRLRILMLLSRERLCVCQLGGVLQISQPKISKNLAKLRDLGLVRDERREKFVYYSLSPDEPVLSALLETISNRCSVHDGRDPQDAILIEDRQRLADKDIYLNICTNIL